MKAKIIHTTDRKFLWRIYEIDSLNVESVKEITWGHFAFDNICLNNWVVKLQNSNYTVLLKII